MTPWKHRTSNIQRTSKCRTLDVGCFDRRKEWTAATGGLKFRRCTRRTSNKLAMNWLSNGMMAGRASSRWRRCDAVVRAPVAKGRRTSWGTFIKILKRHCRRNRLNCGELSAWAATPSSRSGVTVTTRGFIPSNTCAGWRGQNEPPKNSCNHEMHEMHENKSYLPRNGFAP